MSFSQVGLSDVILQALAKSGYKKPTEIQLKAIPLALEGKDIIGCAPTGTGKTAAFVLPIIQRITKRASKAKSFHYPQALILTPTRELAQQIEDAIVKYGNFSTIKAVSIYGGVDITRQIRVLKQGVDIVVATPGRLMDHLDRRTVDLTEIDMLVLDEADRMFDMGFINAVKKIISQIPSERQTLLFSATMSREVRELVKHIQKHPHLIEVGVPFSPVTTVEQHFYGVSQAVKLNLLVHILKTETIESMLVFSRTKHGADKIAKQLERQNIRSAAIHSNRSQSQRQRALDAFKQNQFKVLVATDVAARGIDINNIAYVVNFDIPMFAEDYIHRIGRTGRAGKKGQALTFVSRDEEKYLRRIEQLIGKKLDLKQYPGFAHSDIAHTPLATVENRNRSGFKKRANPFTPVRYSRSRAKQS